MARLPSFEQISSKASDTYRRFPFVLTSAILGTLGVIYLVDLAWNEQEGSYLIQNLCWILALGISLFLAISVVGESREWNRPTRLLSKMAVAALLGIYFMTLPEDFGVSGSVSFYRYITLVLAAHLLVSVAPFIIKKSVPDFWAFNKTLFIRLLLSILYVGVLFSGLSVAIYALEVLLEFDISGVRYAQLAILLNGVFAPWFFLTGVPDPSSLTKREKTYPKGLRIFVKYVLLPLIVVYLMILYLYMGKILIEWEWPNGWVANLVLNFSIIGILGLLLIYPERELKEHSWLRLYQQGFYIALIPLIFLLSLAIWVRITDYGVTVNRYYVATLAVWLTGVAVYFLISKRNDIRIIPASLIIIILLISFGPYSAYTVSERSQINRLEQHLSAYDLLDENGTVRQTDREIPFQDRKQISSGIHYLLELKGVESIQPYFEQDLNDLLANRDSTMGVSNAETVTDLVGIEYVDDWEMEEGGMEFEMFQVQKNRMDPVPLEGFVQYVGDIELWNDTMEVETEFGGQVMTLSYNPEDLELRVTDRRSTGDTLVFDFKSFIKTLAETGSGKVDSLPVDQMTMEQQSDEGRLRVKLVFNSLNGQRQNGEITNLNANFGLYFSFQE